MMLVVGVAYNKNVDGTLVRPTFRLIGLIEAGGTNFVSSIRMFLSSPKRVEHGQLAPTNRRLSERGTVDRQRELVAVSQKRQ